MQKNEYIWNPWYGCHKCSEGCKRCYMFEWAIKNDVDGNKIVINKQEFNDPIIKNQKQYKIPSGSRIMTCINSDFFIQEADLWRKKAWEIIRSRKDCLFYIITKRPERIKKSLPDDWSEGYDNVMISITAENQQRAEERIPILLKLPVKHMGLTLSPMLEHMNISKFLKSGKIEDVTINGEEYSGNNGTARIFKLSWAKSIKQQCDTYNVIFDFCQTGTNVELENGEIKSLDICEQHCENFCRQRELASFIFKE